MKNYLEYFKEEEIDKDSIDIQEDSSEENEEEYNTQELIDYLKDNRATNRDMRAEFAKTIFELALSSDPEARKFIKKVSSFCAYYGDDGQISQEEWQKLNNSESLEEDIQVPFTNKTKLTEYKFKR